MNKKILVCAYFAKNAGDDLFLKILFDRYPDVSWDLLTANRNYNRIFHDYKNVRVIYSYRDLPVGKKNYNLFFAMNNLLLDFNKYNALVHIGGSIFMESPAWKLKLAERDYLVKKFKKKNKKAFIIGANFGPFASQAFIDQYKELFKCYDDVCFRDLYSYNLFKNLSNIRLAPDVVFNLERNMERPENKSVGFSIIDLTNRKDLKPHLHSYNQKMIELIENCSRHNRKVKLFSFCENEGDLRAIDSIRSQVNPAYSNNIETVNYQGNLPEFLREFQSCETIIGTRFHSIILAMVYDQNIFPVIYSDKTWNVLKDLNMTDVSCYVKDIKQLDAEQISNLDNKLKNREKPVMAAGQFEQLDLFLGRNVNESNVKEQV